jgi:hypothetical protein
LLDRSSAPAVVANRTDERRVEVIAALHRLRFTGAEIAELLGMALSTVSGILRRIGLGKLGRLGLEPAQRYERERPGGLIHIDVKKLGRIQGGVGKRVAGHKRYTGQRTDAEGRVRNVIGWEYVHVAIDDATRLAYGGWAYGAIHRDSPERKAALAGWSDIYNRRRPQGALRPPLARLNKLNNLLGNYS